MRHAYLILAHNNWNQLYNLIKLLDSINSDIYIHVDKKAKNFSKKNFDNVCNLSNVYFFSEFKNYWGSYRLVESELFLLEKAVQKKYDYYHLLSGVDLPIKSIKYIENFFEENQGKEFIHFDTDKRLIQDKEIGRRTKLYHWFQNYRRRYEKQYLNNIFTFIEHCSLAIQLILGVDRLKNKNIRIYYGSQWFSITYDLVIYVLNNKKIIRDIFSKTSCSDELVFQTLIMNSEFKNNLYIQERNNSCLSNMRLIDWERGKNGSPYTWKASDFDELCNSECLFARKFSSDFPYDLLMELVSI